MPSQRTITITREHNISQAVWDTITSTDRLNIVIEDIRADKDVSIEIKQFFSLYSVYTELENKRREIEKKLAVIHDDMRRQPLIEEREKDVQEEKQIRINILLTARSFNGMKYSPLIQEVADLFFLGDTQSAFNNLKPDELRSDQDHILALIENGIALENTRDKLIDNANEFKIKAELSILNFDIENPEDRFQKSLFYLESGKKSATYTRSKHFYSGYIFNYAYFLQKHKQYIQAQPLYEEALQIRRQLAEQNPQTYLPEVAIMLNNLALLYSDRNELSQAQPLYEEALQIYRQLAQQNPQTYLPDVASMLNNLALLYKTRNVFSQAQPLHEEALQIRRQLAQQNPQTYLPDVAGSLNNLGELYRAKNEFSQAQPLYEEALQIYRQLAQQNPQTYLPEVAMTLNNLALLYSDRNEFSQAQPLYKEALQIYRQLAQQNPQTYLPDVAHTLNILAILYYQRTEFRQAQPLYEEALQIYRQLAQQNPQTYLPDVASTMGNWANFYKSQNEYSQAQPLYEEALQIYRQLAQQNPQTYLPEVAMTLNNLALLYSDRNEFSQAQPLHEEALQIRRQLAQQNPQTYLPDVAMTLNNLASLYSDRNEISQAQPLFEEAFHIYRQLAQQNPQTYLPNVAKTLYNLAVLYYRRTEFSQAQPLYKEALQIYRQLAQQNPQTYLPDMAMTLNSLGVLYSDRNEFSQAQPLFEEALQIRRQLAQENPQTYLPDVAMTLFNLSIFYKVSIRDEVKSLAYAQEALEISQPYESYLGIAKKICEGARSLLTYWQFNRQSYPISTIGESHTSHKKATEKEFNLDNARKLLDNIRKNILEGSSERALTDTESFVLSFEKIEQEEKESDYDYLAEAKMLLGICYGKRAGNIISAPEDQYLSEAYDLSKHLLNSGDMAVDLYIECAYRKVESLKKQLSGWFPSKKAKRQVALLREEVMELTKGKAISKEYLAFYEEIKNTR